MTNSTNRRNPNSIFDEQVKAINSFGIGTIYKVKDMRNRMSVGKHNTDRVGDYHLDLLSTKCIKRVKRGYYEVVGLIPNFLTLNMCEANRGYTTSIPNPEFIGFTNKKNDPTIESYYVNNILPYKSVQRGKKWKLGEPNPFLNEEVKETEPTVQWSSTVSISQDEAYKRIHGFITDGYKIEARHKVTLAVFIIVSLNGNMAKVKYIGSDTIELVALMNIFDVTLKAAEPQPNKKEQIVNILKQGLSAADAADLILKLI